MKKRHVRRSFFTLLIAVFILAGCSNEHLKELHLMDQQWTEQKLEEYRLDVKPGTLLDDYQLQTEGLKTQSAYLLAGDEKLYVYCFDSEEQLVHGFKAIKAQTVHLSFLPQYYFINNVMIVYFMIGPDQEQFKQVERMVDGFLDEPAK
ncbi:hypothetical protein ACFQZE_08180 [Paenibacillus sp. GCM10027627]|uniref:hypothetical protein n=1 Tax=unclassified Paenibacillus TaxID=185978 RepID=UPI00362CAC8B